MRVGEGFAGPVVAEGRLILFHRVGDQEMVTALDPSNGERFWNHVYPTSYRDDFGFNSGPRATPTVVAGRVFALSAQGRLTALDLATGGLLWTVDLAEQLGARKGFFGAACSPLVVDDKVVVHAGGKEGAGVVAFEAETGKVVWKTSDHEAGYSSPVAATFGGERMILSLTREGLLGLDPATGMRRFEFPFRSRLKASVNAALPVVIGNDVLISATYGVGAKLLRLAKSEGPGAAGRWTATPIWAEQDVLSSHYATSVHHKGYLYGVHGRLEGRPSLRAVSAKTGEVAWSVERFGGATLLLAGDDLVILRNDGELLLAPASPKGFEPVTQGRILVGKVFAYPALADGVLFARSDQGRLVAVDLNPTPPAAAAEP